MIFQLKTHFLTLCDKLPARGNSSTMGINRMRVVRNIEMKKKFEVCIQLSRKNENQDEINLKIHYDWSCTISQPPSLLNQRER